MIVKDIVVDETQVTSSEDVAIFNFDTEAMLFQRFLYGGGVVEIHRDSRELFNIQKRDGR